MRTVALIVACVNPFPICAQAATPAGRDARVIVKLRADSSLVAKAAVAGTMAVPRHADALGRRLGVALRDGAPVAERTQVVLATGIAAEALAQRLAAEPDVEYAVPDQRRRIRTAPNDPLYPAGVAGNGPEAGQWYLRAPDATVKASINVEPAWAVTLGSASIVVADLDTGVRFDHPDLMPVAAGGKLLPGYDLVSDAAVANDGDGRDADASDPGDWITAAEANDTTSEFFQCTDVDPATGKYVAEDSSWHGTQTAGLIGAQANNGIGMAGVGPNIRVLPVRVLGKCGGFDSDVVAGMRWAAGLAVPGVPANPTPARVLNMSLGGDGACPAPYVDAMAAITAAGGVVVVASAGNSTGHAVGAPANCPGVFAVAGLRHVGTKVGYSDLGPEVVVSAPAGNCVNVTPGSPCLYPILTAANTGTTVPAAPTYTDSFSPSLGTSFAAPLVTGTAALVLSAHPSLGPMQVRAILQESARPFPGPAFILDPIPQCTVPQYDAAGKPVDQGECYCTAAACGAGILDAGAAVIAAAASAPTASVVEYYWAARDHYFISADASEIATLDGAPPGGWTRTGLGFGAFGAPSAGANPVCRFYLPPPYGDSHYFSASPAECAAVRAKYPQFVHETPSAFYIGLPDTTTGACPAGTVPVYRLWNNRADTNHRYTTSTTIRNQFVAKGYVPEGYGTPPVAMCAPQ